MSRVRHSPSHSGRPTVVTPHSPGWGAKDAGLRGTLSAVLKTPSSDVQHHRHLGSERCRSVGPVA